MCALLLRMGAHLQDAYKLEQIQSAPMHAFVASHPLLALDTEQGS